MKGFKIVCLKCGTEDKVSTPDTQDSRFNFTDTEFDCYAGDNDCLHVYCSGCGNEIN